MSCAASVQVQRPVFPVRGAVWEDQIPPDSTSENSCVRRWRKVSRLFLRGGVFLGVLARSGVGAADDISLQRAARNSAATSHPGSSVIDALPKLFAVRPD